MLITTKKPTLTNQKLVSSPRIMSNDHGCEVKRLGRSRQSTNYGTVISDHSLHLSLPPSPTQKKTKHLSQCIENAQISYVKPSGSTLYLISKAKQRNKDLVQQIE